MNYIKYIFPFFFIGIWILVNFIISKMGWNDLVKKYLYTDFFAGNRIGIISASINTINYKNCLVLKYNEEGIYLRPILLFRLFHKPLLITWKEINEIRSKKILFNNFKELIIGNPFTAIITVSEKTFKKIEKQIDNSKMKIN